MKFICSVEINKAIEDVIALWKDEANLKHWQDGYLGSELLSDEEGKVGSMTKMHYQIGKRKIELVETILKSNLPYEFLAEYAAKEMVNTMNSHFKSLSKDKTKWRAEVNYTKFNGSGPRVMAFLMPGMFKKQTQKWLDQFKEFSEKQ